MPVDYSKWDALELSDDSDIEVHPNVDKRSFIRAKQTQIHSDRQARRHRIATLKYERLINDGLLARIDALIASLTAHSEDAEGEKGAEEVDEVVFDALMEVQADGALGADQPPRAPEGVHTQGEQPSYSRMMGALIDQVKGEVEKKTGAGAGTARYAAFQEEVGGHKKKVAGLQGELMVELARLEKEESGKITSEGMKMGFDTSHVSKAAAVPVAEGKGKATQTELLNTPSIGEGGAQTPGSEADVEDGALQVAPGEDNDDDLVASELAKKFGKIAFGDYSSSHQFISAHPSILAEKETDGLLVEAFTAQTDAKSRKDEERSRQCVHQALLLQYCRQLGRDGVGLFFKRVQTPSHQARKMFLDDVNSTYARIRSRTAELAKQAEADGGEEKEQIQLHAVEPGTTINIVTPPPLDQCTNDDERGSRQIYETFPPGLQRALASGSLDKVNEVLGKMSVDEAEAVVEQLGQGGMLSLEQGVIDATTEEGRKAMETIEREGRIPGDEQPQGQAPQPAAGKGKVEELEVGDMD